MPVYFVYRCSYGSPSEKFVRRFKHDTVLDWAKAVWKQFGTREEAERYAEKLFGWVEVDPLWGLFNIKVDTERPQTMYDVEAWFTEGLYCEEDSNGPHHIQVLTDWGDNQRAIYVFDDHYLKKNARKTDFLLLDGWELPAGESTKKPPKLPETTQNGEADGEGTVYLVCGFVDCKYNLEDVGPPESIAGLRLPDLARYALLQPDPYDMAFPLGKIHDAIAEVLKKPKGEDAGFLVAIRDQPDELTNWGAYSDWLQDRDLPPAGIHLLDRVMRSDKCAFEGSKRKPEFDCVKVTPHMAQASKHEGYYGPTPKKQKGLTGEDLFTQFIFFDDRWAAAHPVLAANVLTFASRWDVLS